MSTPQFDPNLPAANSEVSSEELRNQFIALETEIEAKANMPWVSPLDQTISNPPTQAEVEAVQAKLNELIAALGP